MGLVSIETFLRAEAARFVRLRFKARVLETLDTCEHFARHYKLHWLVTGLFTLLILPCYVALLGLPFAHWDYCSAINWYLGRPPAHISDLFLVLEASYFKILYFFRPTAGLFFESLALIFGGEFWAYYLTKWIIRFLSIYVLYRVLKSLTVNQPMAVAAFAFLILHPTVFEPMLFSPDALAASLMVFATFCILGGEGNRSPSRRVGAGIAGGLLFVAALGAKETPIVWGMTMAALVSYLLVIRRKRCPNLIWMLGIVLAASAFWLPRLYKSTQFRKDQSESLSVVGSTFMQHLGFLTPYSEMTTFLLMGAFVSGSVVLLVRRRQKSKIQLDHVLFGLVIFLCSMLMLFASSLVEVRAARYTIPSIYGFTFSLFLIGGLLVRRWAALTASMVVLSAGLLGAGNIYRQTVAYQQMLNEFQDAITYLRDEASKGRTISYSKADLVLGIGTNLKLFFDVYGPAFYGMDRIEVIPLEDMEKGAERVSLLSRLDLESAQDLAAGAGLRICGATYVPLGNYGVTEWTVAFLGSVESVIGIQGRSYWDKGTSPIRRAGRFVIYELCKGGRKASGWTASYVSTLEFGGKKSWPVRLARLPRDLPRIALVEVDCDGSIEGGSISFGIRERGGRGLWNTRLEVGGQELPSIPVTVFEEGQDYDLFLFGRRLSERRLLFQKGCTYRVWPVREYQAPRRFGAFSR